MPTYEIKTINKPQLAQFQAWTDQYGMVQDNNKGDVTGNGNLFTAHYVAGLVLTGIVTPEERDRINQVFTNNFKLPGLLTRAPCKADDRQAHDDIVGLLGADSLLNKENRFLTRQIYEYGRNNYCDGIDPDQEKLSFNTKVYGWLKRAFFGKVRWCWNNVNLNKFHVSSWLQRRMELMATMQMSLQEQVNVGYWLYWAATMYFWARGKTVDSNEDSYILRFHMALASQGYGKLTDKICQMVRDKVARDGGMGLILQRYFNNPDHPLVKLLSQIG